MLCFIAALVPSCIPSTQNEPIDCTSFYHEGYNQGWIDGRDAAAQCCDVCILYPTREQVATFLASDNTSEIAYNKKSFICTDFAEIMNHNAWDAGILCYTAWITYEDFYVGHPIAVFPTCNLGKVVLFYNDPQIGDELFDEDAIAVGRLYPAKICDLDGNDCIFRKIGKIRIYK